MVAPVLAAAVRAAPAITKGGGGLSGMAARYGPAMRSAGGKMMHSSNEGERKAGSRLLHTKDVSDGVKRIAGQFDKSLKIADMALKGISKISQFAARILGTLAKASPALKQQLVVLGKGFQLILRPIGDVMAKFLRPMAIWVMKVAMKWYSLFGSKTAGSKGDPADALEAAIKQKESLIAGGASEEEIAMADQAVKDARANMNPEKEGNSIWANLIPESFKETLKLLGELFKSLWEALSSLGKLIWDLVGPAVKIIADAIGLVLLGAITAVNAVIVLLINAINAVRDRIESWREMLANFREVLGNIGDWMKNTFVKIWDTLWEGLKNIGTWISTIFSKVWDSLKNRMTIVWEWVSNIFIKVWDSLKSGLTTLYDWVKNVFLGVWDSLKSALSGVFSKISSWIDKLKFWDKGDDKEDKPKSRAVGGFIEKTGLALLHAGERVMPAGEVARGMAGGTSNAFTFNNNFVVQATINNEMDIANLAEELADYTETELRRRASYV